MNIEEESYFLVSDDLKKLRLELGHSIANLKKVYLDTKYWILLRDVVLQRNKNSILKDILDLLKQGVTEKKLICPIYFPLFLEITQQDDEECLQCIINLIDELSGGICLTYSSERISLEITYFYYAVSGMESLCYPPQDLAWTKVSQILFTTMRYLYKLPLATNLTLQKRFLDKIWKLASLNEIKDIMGIKNFQSHSHREQMERMAENLNKGKFLHEHEVITFKNTFQSEIAGFIDTIAPEITNVIENIYKHFGQKTKNEDFRVARNIIYNLFKFDKVGTLLPTIDIQARIHTAIRYDKGRKIKSNDILDFEHATGALPYYDLFLTERSLCTLLNRTDMNLAKKYSCCTVHSEEDAFQELLKFIAC